MLQPPISYGPYKKYEGAWGIQSESNPEKTYTVVRIGDSWACSCPRWTLNRNRPNCKHIERVKAWLAANQKVEPVPVPEKVQKALEKLSEFSFVEV